MSFENETHLFDTFDANDGTTYRRLDFTSDPLEMTDALKSHLAAGRSEATFTGEGFKPMNCTYKADVSAATVDGLNAAITEIENAATRMSRWCFQRKNATAMHFAYPISVTSSVEIFPSSATEAAAEITFAIICRPGWRVSSYDVAGQVITNVPGYVNINNVPGDLPADTILWSWAEQATNGQAIGLKANASLDNTYIQDYSGVSDANARGGAAASGMMASEWGTIIGTPTELDVASYAGSYKAWPRFKSAAASGQTTTKARILNTVGGAVGFTLADVDFIRPSLNNDGYETKDLGLIEIPAVRVPISTGWAPEAAQITQDTQDTWSSTHLAERFSLTAPTKINSVTLYYQGLGSGGPLTVSVRASKDGAILASAQVASAVIAAGAHIVELPGVELPGGTYYLQVDGDTTWHVHFKNSGNPYANGSLWERAVGDWIEDPASDLYFVITGQVNMAFSQSVGFQGLSSESSKTMLLDNMALVPCDQGYVAYTGPLAANQGMRVESLPGPEASDVYFTDNIGRIGYSLSGPNLNRIGKLQLQPGDNRIVCAAYTPKDAAPGAVTIGATVTPVYKTPDGDG